MKKSLQVPLMSPYRDHARRIPTRGSPTSYGPAKFGLGCFRRSTSRTR